MRSAQFKTKKEAINFIRKNGGYYEIAVDEYARSSYIVFYK